MIIYNTENRLEITRNASIARHKKAKGDASTLTESDKNTDTEILSVDAVEVTTSDQEKESKKQHFSRDNTEQNTEEVPPHEAPLDTLPKKSIDIRV